MKKNFVIIMMLMICISMDIFAQGNSKLEKDTTTNNESRVDTLEAFDILNLPDIIEKAYKGDVESQLYLGRLFENGHDDPEIKVVVKKDAEKAVYWYTKAAENGNIDAQKILIQNYHFGGLVPKDLSKAVYWVKILAEKGLKECECTLGVYYFLGEGVEQDYEQAAYWFRKAADQGHDFGQLSLGICYEYGQGVTKDMNEAVKWYRLSANQGNEKAKDALKRLGY